MTKIFTKEMKEFLKENVKGITSQELTDRINKKFNTAFTKGQIKNWKSREKQPSGIEGCGFKAGHTPHNKGKKTPEWVKEKIKAALEKYNLPTEYSADTDALMSYVLHDKKMSGKEITVIFCNEIGTYEMKKIKADEIVKLIEGGR